MKYFQPKLLECLKGYKLSTFIADLGAGVGVGIIALPLAMAFGIASGVTPEQGLITAVIAGFLISAFGGSKVQVGGPTGAFVVIVLGIVTQYGYSGLAISTFMAGIFLLFMGFAKMGSVIRYIPRPVTIGFTNGIAVLIISTQIKDFFGFKISRRPEDFVDTISLIWQNISTISFAAAIMSIICVLIIWYWPKKFAARVPGSIIAILLATLATVFLKIPVETIGDKFGEISSELPKFKMFAISWDEVRNLLSPAITIAILAAIESLLSAVVADGLIEEKHNSNQELLGQGIANVIVPFFGGIPATGAIARTAANIKNGAKTPVAGIIHSITLLIILLVLAPYAKFIPLCCLSAVLFIVAYNMGEWHEFRMVRRMPLSDATVLIITFLLTIFFDLTIAVEVGMLFAAMLFIRRVSASTEVSPFDDKAEHENFIDTLEGKDVPAGVMVFRVFGVLMFGAADKLESILGRHSMPPKIIIIRMRTVLAMDATALDALDRIRIKLNRQGIDLVISGAHSQPLQMMRKSGFLNKIGHDHVFENIDLALAKARELLSAKQS